MTAPVDAAPRGSLEPWIKDEVQFYKHQVEGVRDGAKRRSFILGDDMGLGKTIQALTIFAVDVARGWAQALIIIAPTTLTGNWVDEIEEKTGFPYVVLDGPPEERNKQLLTYMMMTGPRILIISYEHAHLHEQPFQKLQFDVAIYDEAHLIKTPTARRTISVLGIRSRRSLMLTGTPMMNRVDELWSILHRIDPEKFPKFFRFVNRYCVFGGHNNRQVVGVKNEAELVQHVQSRMIRRMKKDVLDLPEVQIIPRRVDLHPRQQEVYTELIDNLRLERLDDEVEEIDNALTKFLRCKQICGTLFPFTGEDISSKLDLATYEDREVLENGNKLVVFTQFRDVQDCYIRRMEEMDVPIFAISGSTPALDRPAMAKRWAKVEGPAIFIGMLQVATEGLNLTAARHGSFLDKLFNPAKEDQAIDRLNRIGQGTQPVQIRQYICRNTVENRVEQIIRSKRKLVDKIINTDPDWKKKLLKMVLEGE